MRIEVELEDIAGNTIKEVIIEWGEEHPTEQPDAIRVGEKVYVYSVTADTYPRPDNQPILIYREALVYDLISP